MQLLLWRVLNAFASVVALEEDGHAHECIMESGSDSDLFVGNSLIDIYIKCGSMEACMESVQQDAHTKCRLL
jgi:hypothetical protein